MYEKITSFDEVLQLVSMNHKITNKAEIKKAYLYAEKKHSGQNRETGEPYIMHPLRVACFVAEWGFESDVVIAALLHDVVEDCSTPLEEISFEFGSSIAAMVDTVTKLNKHLKIYEGLTKEEMHVLSDAKLQQYITDKALFIKIADRLDNLSTIEGLSEAKQFEKARHTREIILPMVIKEGAFKLVDELEELCFQIEHKAYHTAILDKIIKYKQANEDYCKKTIELFTELFDDKNPLVPRGLKTYQKYISGFSINERSAVSIFRQISKAADNIKADFDVLTSKRNIAFYDMTLVIGNLFNDGTDLISPYDIFFKYYVSALSGNGICILKRCTTTYKNAYYLLLCDNMDNLYRLFIMSDSEYMHYKLGSIVDTDTSLSFVDINDIEPRDTYKDKIKVFKRNGAACYIDKGATVLDFAFLIHSEIGIHFDYAMIDDSKTRLPAYHRLNEGDTITIYTSEKETAKIQWFNYLKTSKAIHHLVKKFSSISS